MAIAYEGVGALLNGPFATTATATFTSGTNSNRTLLAWCSRESDDTPSISGMTWAGNALTLGSDFDPTIPAGISHARPGSLIGDDSSHVVSGSQNLVATMSSGAAKPCVIGTAFSGVSTINNLVGVDQASLTTTTFTINGSNGDTAVLLVISDSSSTITSSNGTIAATGTSGSRNYAVVTRAMTGASTTITVTGSSGSSWTGISASMTPAAAAATGVTMSGPTSGTVGVASSNFTIGVTPGGGTISGTLVVTPSDGGAGGTFTPTTVSLTTGSPTGTFTYAAASSGAKTISVTNGGGLTNPSNITYTASAAGRLFRSNPGGSLSGLGSSGPFFQNPLQ